MEAHVGQGRPTKSLEEEILKRLMANADSTKGKVIKIKRNTTKKKKKKKEQKFKKKKVKIKKKKVNLFFY